MIFFTPCWVSGTRRKSNLLLCEARKHTSFSNSLGSVERGMTPRRNTEVPSAAVAKTAFSERSSKSHIKSERAESHKLLELIHTHSQTDEQADSHAHTNTHTDIP